MCALLRRPTYGQQPSINHPLPFPGPPACWSSHDHFLSSISIRLQQHQHQTLASCFQPTACVVRYVYIDCFLSDSETQSTKQRSRLLSAPHGMPHSALCNTGPCSVFKACPCPCRSHYTMQERKGAPKREKQCKQKSRGSNELWRAVAEERVQHTLHATGCQPSQARPGGSSHARRGFQPSPCLEGQARKPHFTSSHLTSSRRRSPQSQRASGAGSRASCRSCYTSAMRRLAGRRCSCRRLRPRESTSSRGAG